jgi:recombination protein RecA
MPKEEKDSDKTRKSIISSLSKVMRDDAAFSFANDRKKDFDLISTGDAELDRILTPDIYEERKVGGVPRGFLCEFFGPEAGGKSSLGMMLAADVTKRGGMVLWVDAEGSWVEHWAINHGIKLENVVIIETGKSGEDYFGAIKAAAASGNFELIVLDSMASVQPKNVQETELEKDPRIGAMARLMHRVCPQLTAAAKAGNCSIILINQIRHKISMYGNPETTPGGLSLKFYASLRLRLSQVSSRDGRGIVKDGEEIGIRSNVQVVKSRFGPPFQETVLSIYYTDVKPHPYDILIDLAIKKKVVKCKSRRDKVTEELVQFFSLDDNDVLKGIAGIDEFKVELRKHPEAIREVYRILVEKMSEDGKTIDHEVAQFVQEFEKKDDVLASE